MNRGLLGCLILAAFLVAGLWSARAMTDFHDPLAAQLDRAAALALSGDMTQAKDITAQAKQEWQAHWDQVAILADHTPMDEIDTLFARLEAFASSGNNAQFAACCKELVILISATAEAHTLTLKNIL